MGTEDLAGRRVLLLIPGATYRAADFVAAATRLRLDLVVGSDGALPLGSRPVVHVDPRDLPASVERLARSVDGIDAVVAVDTPMLPLAAAAAARLGLRHNPLEAVRAAMDKAAQRSVWAAAGVLQPAFRLVPAASDDRVVASAAAAVGLPCVVKAVSLSGSQGVLRADDAAGAVTAARRLRQLLAGIGQPKQEPLLVEEYVPGWEISIDGLVGEGAMAVVAVFDKPDTPDGPTFEETVLITPSGLPQPVLAAAIGVAERAARALGLRYGPIHAELRIDERRGGSQPTMIELAARSIGGLCSRALRLLGGMSLEEMVLANALGRDVAPQRACGSSGVLMLPVERAGVLRAVDGQAEATAVRGITGVSITIPLGQSVRPLPDGDRYLGFIFAEGLTPADVESALRAASQRLRVVIA